MNNKSTLTVLSTVSVHLLRVGTLQFSSHTRLNYRCTAFILLHKYGLNCNIKILTQILKTECFYPLINYLKLLLDF